MRRPSNDLRGLVFRVRLRMPQITNLHSKVLTEVSLQLALECQLTEDSTIQAIADQLFHHRWFSQGTGITKTVQLVAGNLAQYASHDLTRAGLR